MKSAAIVQNNNANGGLPIKKHVVSKSRPFVLATLSESTAGSASKSMQLNHKKMDLIRSEAISGDINVHL